MAMTRTESAEASMDRRWSLAAAAASVLLAAAGGVALLLLAWQAPPEARLLPAALLWGAVALAALAGALQLLRRDLWGQRILLVLWLLVGTAGLIFTLYGALWDVPAWLGEMLGRGEETDLQTPGVLGALAVAVLAAAAAVLALQASAADSRLRYSGTVLVTSAAAVALLVAANMAAQARSARLDLAQFGQYQMSERTRRIVEGVEEPLTLTCVYTGQAKPEAGIKKAVAYRPRVLEFLHNVEELNPRLAVRNVTTEAGKRKLVDRLGRKLAGQFRQHRQLLEDFVRQVEPLRAQLEEADKAWGAPPAGCYVARWGRASVRGALKDLSEKLGDLRDTIRHDLDKALIDYGQRVQELRDALEKQANQLQEIETLAKELDRLPELVEPRSETVHTRLAAAVQAVRDLAASLGTPDAPVPEDPAAALAAYADAAKAAAERLHAAGKALAGLTEGTPLAQLVWARWTMPAMSSGGFRLDVPLYEWFGAHAEQFESYAGQVRAEIQKRTKQAQTDLLKILRQSTPGPDAFVEAQQKARGMVTYLTDVDPASRKLLRQMRDEALVAPARKTLSTLVQRAREVEQAAPPQRSKEWAGEEIPDNVVVVETGGENGRAALVRFEQVWQLGQELPLGADDAGQDQERIFHGDEAISSTILHLTADRPFAVVYLTYLGGAQMEQAWPYVPDNVQALRERLEQANFEVRQWNLAESPEPPAESDDEADPAPLPKALLVLPPPPEALVRMLGMRAGQYGEPPQPFGSEHLESIRSQIDAGTPAVFLAGWLPPMRFSLFGGRVSPTYEFGRYLRDTWGIDVRTDYVLVPFIPDEDEPGQFRVDAEGFEYLPLNTFNDAHPISEPLAGQRVLWTGLCPVEIASPPAGVDAHPLLQVRKGRRDIWAEPGIDEIRETIHSGKLIAPNFNAAERPDLPAPLTVAVAASRSADKDSGVKQTRIVVLGVGRSLLDGYLDQKVYRLERGLSAADPPRTDADLMINSLYWLIGREKYIAAGPAVGKPIAPVAPATERALKLVYWFGLPAVVIAVGVLVTLLRRRH